MCQSTTAHIRPAVPADALCLGVLATQVFLDTYATSGVRSAIANEVLKSFSTSAIRELLGRPDTFVFVAEVRDHLVGFAQVTLATRHELVDSPVPAELDRLYVQEPFVRLGIGSQLIRKAEDHASELKATAIWLTPWVHNTRALQFYSQHRYVDLGPTLYFMDGEQIENRVLCKAFAG